MTRGRAGSLLLSLTLAVAVLGALEWGAREFADTPPSRLPYQRLRLPVLASVGDRLVTADPRIPYQEVSAPEVSETEAPLVVVFGGSAAAGLGFSPNAAFPRHLERLLRRDVPNTQVLNLGLVAASSREVRWMVEDVLATTSPDMLVIYSGNNEYLEVASARYAWALAGPVGKARLLAAQSRVFGLWRSLGAQPTAPVGLPRVSGAEMDAEISLGEGDHQRVLAAYEANLRAIVQQASMPVLLATVGTNSDWTEASHRRATLEMAAIVRRVAADEGATLCDIAAAEDVAGFDAFYDHIHFTPQGAARVGVALYQALGGSENASGYLENFDISSRASARAVGDWLGADPSSASDRDLWKYDALLAGLDARIAASPDDFDALVFRGNGWFFQQDGAAQAEALWRQAVQLREDERVRDNLRVLALQARSRTP
jgi:lysophospholipase L1-like esterase